eukprot:CAMPEP_0196587590 /NCGR_PEP_ID=MMETSP1081-20130531/57954_1 /TAXON_ID=36882 /ORGANISM="Pyramimonas amylifera, Strain CCMP720" /LENGTH=369 /DNA_ID=CAMNT_0041909809 /DNA_START=87 /DNA_END=1196 /DNA_ORIENTATION=-
MSVTCSSINFLQKTAYTAPSWATKLKHPPEEKYSLGIFPTPIHRWDVPGVPEGCELWIKRDDLTGMQLSGNKVRKLEFLLADAKAQGCDCVVTIGGVQSNHCRATAVAARYLGLDSHLILRTSLEGVDQDPGLVGNLLVSRMVGAQLEMVTREEYIQLGSEELLRQLGARLETEGRKPYLIPVGGSNALGTWGYLEAVAELERQLAGGCPIGTVDELVTASGSGGTAAGLALGCHLSDLKCKVRAYGVCDDPSYFHGHIQSIFDQLSAPASSPDILQCEQAKGRGYAVSSDDELELIQQVALTTGVVLDPVYSGKALYMLLKDMAADPLEWLGKKVVFIHTGGLLGMYDKCRQLQPLTEGLNKASRFVV